VLQAVLPRGLEDALKAPLRERLVAGIDEQLQCW
jgi:hypothetical protein